MTHQIRANDPLGKERPWPTVARVFFFLLLVSVLLLGCTSDANERAHRITTLYLRASDLPPGWQRSDGGIGDWDQEREGVISRSLSYYGAPRDQVLGVLVTHELVDYPSATQAKDAYPKVVQAEIPTEAWTSPDQVHFESQADQIRIACLPASAQTTLCRSVAQYGNYISIIYANVFTDKWLTMQDFERLLESIDTRLAAARDES
jgi:hypothetical protein